MDLRHPSHTARRRRAAAVIGLVLLTLTGCGDDDAEPAAGTSTTVTDTTTTTAAADGSGPIELSADLPGHVPAGPFTWEFTITNTGDEPVTLTFPTSQEGEAVLTDDGTVAHRFSEGKFFTQVIRELTLEPGRSETIRLDDNLSAVEPGTYDLALRPAVQSTVGTLTERVEVIPGS